MVKKAQIGSMTEGSIGKKLVLFAIPVLLSNLFQQLYNTADSIVVGNFVGSTALAAVGSTSALISLLVGFFLGISTGASVLVSQFFGAKQHDELQRAEQTALALALVGGAVLTVAGITLSPFILRLMRTPEDVLPLSVIYLRVYFLGMIPAMVYNAGAAILRAVGDSKRPLYYLVISSIINISLNLFFVLVMKWGVAGVALGTTISQTVTAILVVRQLTKSDEVYCLNLKQIGFDKEMLKRIIKVGLPVGGQSVVIDLSNIIIQTYINMFGAAAMAGYAAWSKLGGFIYMPTKAFGLAMTTFTGQNIGAKNPDRVKKGMWICAGMSVSIAILLGAVIQIFGVPLLSMFTREQEVIEFGMVVLRIMTSTYFLYALNEVLSGVLCGSGKSFPSMLIATLNMCALRVLWIVCMTNVWPSISTQLLYVKASDLSTIEMIYNELASRTDLPPLGLVIASGGQYSGIYWNRQWDENILYTPYGRFLVLEKWNRQQG